MNQRQFIPHPPVKMSDSVTFHGTGNLEVGNFDSLRIDKTTKNHQRWLLHKSRKNVPDLETHIFSNGLLIEKLERVAHAASTGATHVTDTAFKTFTDECKQQMMNPRSDSAQALDRLEYFLYIFTDICLTITY